MAKQRLNKFLAEKGICSRRQADELIAKGLVKVNGRVAELGLQVNDQDDIVVRGKKVRTGKPGKIYMAFHKPVGIMTSVDPSAKDTVRSFLQLKERVFPVGRLDVASSGLLILTNDGDLSEAITHPRYHHEKEYSVTVDREISDADLKRLESGIHVLGSKTKRARVKRESKYKFRIVLTEGRNRQIRRMCEALNYQVKALKRTRVMNIELGALPVGKTRPLSEGELKVLKRAIVQSKGRVQGKIDKSRK